MGESWLVQKNVFLRARSEGGGSVGSGRVATGQVHKPAARQKVVARGSKKAMITATKRKHGAGGIEAGKRQEKPKKRKAGEYPRAPEVPKSPALSAHASITAHRELANPASGVVEDTAEKRPAPLSPEEKIKKAEEEKEPLEEKEGDSPAQVGQAIAAVARAQAMEADPRLDVPKVGPIGPGTEADPIEVETGFVGGQPEFSPQMARELPEVPAEPAPHLEEEVDIPKAQTGGTTEARHKEFRAEMLAAPIQVGDDTPINLREEWEDMPEADAPPPPPLEAGTTPVPTVPAGTINLDTDPVHAQAANRL